MKILTSIFIGLVILQPHSSYGYQTTSETFRSRDYYQFKVQDRLSIINLLDIKRVVGAFPQPAERYDREKHFGTWVNPQSDDSCLDVRGLVLQRDAIDHDIRTSRRCRVKTGVWLDPYTGQYLDSPDLVQIDHMVPLKNAYMTGAHEWDARRRCLYANYMGNKFHLISVYGLENQSKSDRAPDSYVPPNKKFVCTYLKNWLEVKLIWNLKITPNERLGILKMIAQENCQLKEFVIRQTDYRAQQKYIRDHANFCQL